MPHTPAAKKRAVNRLRRIQGQAEALARQIDAGAECADVLQQLAAMRGAVNGLMRDVMEDHLRESFGHAGCTDSDHAPVHQSIDNAIALVKSYIK